MLTTKSKKLLAEINMTPFVDVMLVLLVIFMVTAPMMVQGIDVTLPEIKEPTSFSQVADKIIVTVDENSVVWVEDVKVSLDLLAEYVGTLAEDAKKEVFLNADKNVPYGLVVAIMGELKLAGVSTLGIIADEDFDNAMLKKEKK